MSKGEWDLSRARGAKAQRRQQQQQQYHAVENTIDFRPHTRLPARNIELVPKSRNQERLILALNDTDNHVVIAVGPAGTGKSYLAMLAAIRALRTGRM